MNPSFEKFKAKLQDLEAWKEGFTQEYQPFLNVNEVHKQYEDLGGYRHSLQVLRQIMVQLDFLKTKSNRQKEDWMRSDESFLETSSPQKPYLNSSAIN